MSVFGTAQAFAILLVFMSVFVKRWRRHLLTAAALASCGSLIFHATLARPEAKGFRLFSIPDNHARSHFFQRLVDEKDVVLVGTKIYSAVFRLKPFQAAFEKQYDDLEREIGWPLATPVLSALSEEDSISRNWAVEFSPSQASEAKPAVFLHGGMGSYVIQCWMVASVLRQQGYAVICPALSFEGRWVSPTGEKVLFRTVEYMKRAYKKKKILYVGLSNGASGLTRYRRRLSVEAKGFILISGGEAVRFGDSLPTLLLWGRKDENVSFNHALKIEKLNVNIALDSVDDDHSAFARQHKYFSARILSWLPNLRN